MPRSETVGASKPLRRRGREAGVEKEEGMGFLTSLFGSDPTKDLERADRLLSEGEARRALELAQRVLDGGRLTDSSPAREMVDRAREAVIRDAFERAATAETSEYWDDAAEWLEGVFDVLDDERRHDVEKRHADLLEKARQAAIEPEIDLEAYGSSRGMLAEDPEIASENLYDTLVDMLEDGIALQYRAQSGAFEKAFLAFHDGEFSTARELYELLVNDDPGNTVARFERGRCRLHDGDAARALEDFEAVWRELGNDSLDRAATLSVPGLWAEAQLALGETTGILERLKDLARPELGRAEVVLPFAQALALGERFEEAEHYLRRAIGSFPSIPDLPLLYASVLARLERRGDAIQCLEAAIAPSCSTGNCQRPPMHLPSIRTLIAWRLEAGDDLERVRALLEILVQATGGNLGPDDHRMMAAYYDRVGNDEAAAEALRRAAEVEKAVAGE